MNWLVIHEKNGYIVHIAPQQFKDRAISEAEKKAAELGYKEAHKTDYLWEWGYEDPYDERPYVVYVYDLSKQEVLSK